MVAMAVIAAVAVLACFFILRSPLLDLWSMMRRVPFKQAECERIVRLIETGRLVPDPEGQVVLPTGMSSATIRGRVYVTRKSRERLYVLFPMWKDKGADLEGYLYSSQRLTSSDVETRPGGSDLKIVTVTGPISGHFARRGIGPIPYTVTRGVGPHWYAVSNNMD
jgi:hypothetical protein